VQRPLSSSLIGWWKFVFPIVWVAGFGAVTVAIWLGAFSGLDNEPASEWMRWQSLIMWLAGSLWLIWFSRRICRVGISEDTIFASNYSRHIGVPLSAILRVSQSYMSRPQTITIHLDRETTLGRKIVFIPHGVPHYLSRHPVTDQLLAIVDRYHPAPPVSDVAGTSWATNPDHTNDDNKEGASSETGTSER
jgi:hypothetical protein